LLPDFDSRNDAASKFIGAHDVSVTRAQLNM
jgi:hypothetical protein